MVVGEGLAPTRRCGRRPWIVHRARTCAVRVLLSPHGGRHVPAPARSTAAASRCAAGPARPRSVGPSARRDAGHCHRRSPTFRSRDCRRSAAVVRTPGPLADQRGRARHCRLAGREAEIAAWEPRSRRRRTRPAGGREASPAGLAPTAMLPGFDPLTSATATSPWLTGRVGRALGSTSTAFAASDALTAGRTCTRSRYSLVSEERSPAARASAADGRARRLAGAEGDHRLVGGREDVLAAHSYAGSATWSWGRSSGSRACACSARCARASGWRPPRRCGSGTPVIGGPTAASAAVRDGVDGYLTDGPEQTGRTPGAIWWVTRARSRWAAPDASSARALP